MQTLVHRLRSLPILGPLTTEQLNSLSEEMEIINASPGEIIIQQDEPMERHLILIEGEIEAQRIWSVPGENDKSYTWTLDAEGNENGLAFLGAANKIRARALTAIKYLLLDADKVDEMIGWDAQLSDELLNDAVLKQRMNMIKRVSVFCKIPLENIKQAFQRLQTLQVETGDTIVTQGEVGDSYYIIENGLCDVVQTDPFTDETGCVNHLGPGDAFGEEALIQNGYRSATVTMTSPGTLLVLDKQDFDNLLRTEIITEVDPDEALSLINDQQAQWLDCRYDMEYEESRISGAKLMSLGELRKKMHDLEPDKTYIVYCRSGRRSSAAAFLLKERGIEAISLRGGIKDWPYEIDVEPVQ